MKAPAPHVRHWRRTRRLTAVLLALWFLAAFLGVFFARELASLRIVGWPLSFWMAAQGVSLAFLAIVGWYVWKMDRIDADYRADEERA